jgi:hypothetical protein
MLRVVKPCVENDCRQLLKTTGLSLVKIALEDSRKVGSRVCRPWDGINKKEMQSDWIFSSRTCVHA